MKNPGKGKNKTPDLPPSIKVNEQSVVDLDEKDKTEVKENPVNAILLGIVLLSALVIPALLYQIRKLRKKLGSQGNSDRQTNVRYMGKLQIKDNEIRELRKQLSEYATLREQMSQRHHERIEASETERQNAEHRVQELWQQVTIFRTALETVRDAYAPDIEIPQVINGAFCLSLLDEIENGFVAEILDYQLVAHNVVLPKTEIPKNRASAWEHLRQLHRQMTTVRRMKANEILRLLNGPLAACTSDTEKLEEQLSQVKTDIHLYLNIIHQELQGLDQENTEHQNLIDAISAIFVALNESHQHIKELEQNQYSEDSSNEEIPSEPVRTLTGLSAPEDPPSPKNSELVLVCPPIHHHVSDGTGGE